MKWSWKLGRVFGIDLFIHATFLLLMVRDAIRTSSQKRPMLKLVA